MRTARHLILATLFCTSALPMLQAQSTPAPQAEAPVQTYKLTFTVTQLVKGKEEGRRVYSALYSSQRSYAGSIRAQNKVARPMGAPPADSSMITQYTYETVGVDIDFNGAPDVVKDAGPHRLPLMISADLTSLAPSTNPRISAPVIREDRWKSTLVVTLDKPTALFISDDPGTDLTTRVDLTATLAPAQ